jgi:hypothetical protein
MKYVASRVYIASLIPSATYTWQDGDTGIDLVADFGINLADFVTPYILTVSGVPYNFRDFIEWTQLKAVPSSSVRISISAPVSIDERPGATYTIDPNSVILLNPEPSEDEVVELFYRVSPAPYADLTVPEIPSDWDWILVDGGVSWVQAWENNEDQILTPSQIFVNLNKPIRDLNLAINSGRRHSKLKLAFSYRIPK